jgi:membrane-bound metal-dependent hydrolase YbcI (DUF457 family)
MARELPPREIALEVIGGLFGGRVGGRMPDVFDPPFCPSHRDFAHSLTAAGILATVAYKKLGEWQTWLRTKADECAAKQAAAEPGSVESLFWLLAAAALRMLAGFLAGLVGGYLSHIAMDAFTPMSIRLV